MGFMAWREIHHNFFVDNYSPQEDVDNDDGSAFYHTHHNFLVYGGQGMKNDFGGHDNHHFNNVYAYIGRAMGVCPRSNRCLSIGACMLRCLFQTLLSGLRVVRWFWPRADT